VPVGAALCRSRNPSCLVAWIRLGYLTKEFFRSLSLTALQLAGHHDPYPSVQVAHAPALEARHPLSGQPERLTGLCPGGYLQQHAATERLNFHFAAEQRLSERDWQLAGEVRGVASENRVRPDLRDQIQIARVGARPGLAAQAYLATGFYAGRNLHFEAPIADLDESGGALKGLFKAQVDFDLDVFAPAGTAAAW